MGVVEEEELHKSQVEVCMCNSDVIRVMSLIGCRSWCGCGGEEEKGAWQGKTLPIRLRPPGMSQPVWLPG